MVQKAIGRSSSVERFKRSDNYRKEFLKKKKGFLGTGKLYCCSYCGRLLTKGGMQVDHCISVGSMQSSRLARAYVKFVGLFSDKKTKEQGVNGVWNLIPSCPKCNHKKSDSGGLWVVRGIIGRYLFPALWYGAAGAIMLTFAQYLTTGAGVWRYVSLAVRSVSEFLIYLGGVI